MSELAELADELAPHVIHLSGHGKLGGDGEGTFAFESERGLTDSRPAGTIVDDVVRGRDVRCVFLNGCQTSQAATAGLCQSFVRAGVPQILGWAASVADDLATDFATKVYGHLLRGNPLAQAVARARKAIRDDTIDTVGSEEVVDATFAIPQVWARGGAEVEELLDRNRTDPDPPESTVRYVLADGVAGMKKGFVGRRRELQRWRPALRDGSTTFLLITGIGGAGKSTFATRLANDLAGGPGGFKAWAVKADGTGATARDRGQATLSKLIAVLERIFAEPGSETALDMLKSDRLDLVQKVRKAIEALDELHAVLVVDDFEQVLDLETRAIADPELAAVYGALASQLTRGSRVLLTCRYLPRETPSDIATFAHLALPDLKSHDATKLLRREPEVERRFREGEVRRDELEDLYREIGGTPGFLGEISAVLKSASLASLLEELEQTGEGRLADKREDYLRRILAEHLYASLPGDARQLASRAATSILPVPKEALARIARQDDPSIAPSIGSAAALGFLEVYREKDLPDLYAVPGILRPWLTDPLRLSEEDALATHLELAGFWRESYEQDRERELRVLIDAELRACLHHATSAGAAETRCWAAARLAGALERRCEWSGARDLLEEIPEADRTLECTRILINLDLDQGEYQRGRQRAEANLARITKNEGGDRAGEAATLANLGTLALRTGDYPGAREAFAKSLEMRQALGDRAGEAATFAQVGIALFQRRGGGDGRVAMMLMSIGHGILHAIGNADEKVAWSNLAGAAAELGYSQEQLDELMKSAAEEYAKDQGRRLFGEAVRGLRDAGGEQAESS